MKSPVMSFDVPAGCDLERIGQRARNPSLSSPIFIVVIIVARPPLWPLDPLTVGWKAWLN